MDDCCLPLCDQVKHVYGLHKGVASLKATLGCQNRRMKGQVTMKHLPLSIDGPRWLWKKCHRALNAL